MTDKYKSTVIAPCIVETIQGLEVAREIQQEHETHFKEYKKIATARYVDSILKPFYKLREDAREEMKTQVSVKPHSIGTNVLKLYWT